MSQFSSDELFRLDEIERLRAENEQLMEQIERDIQLVMQSNNKLRAALLPYAERAIESEDGGKIARAALNEETK